MANKKLQSLRDQDLKDLEAKVKLLRKEILQLTPRMSVGEIKDLKAKSKKRREIAQILGIIREKELQK